MLSVKHESQFRKAFNHELAESDCRTYSVRKLVDLYVNTYDSASQLRSPTFFAGTGHQK